MVYVNAKNSGTVFAMIEIALVSLANFPGGVACIVYCLDTLQRWVLQSCLM